MTPRKVPEINYVLFPDTLGLRQPLTGEEFHHDPQCGGCGARYCLIRCLSPVFIGDGRRFHHDPRSFSDCNGRLFSVLFALCIYNFPDVPQYSSTWSTSTGRNIERPWLYSTEKEVDNFDSLKFYSLQRFAVSHFHWKSVFLRVP
jgi:hypothetical protein